MPILSRSEAEDLLYREARLLDDLRHQEWLAMLDENATLRDVGAVEGSTFLLTSRRRRPVKS